MNDCLTCNVLDFRTLLGTDCVPNDGYYDDGNNHVALPCNITQCVTCNNTATNCTSCVLGRYLLTSNHTCQSCSTYCLNCTSFTTCN